MSKSKRGDVDRSQDRSQPLEKLHPNDTIKAGSRSLRGTIVESLADPITGALLGTDHELTKFHGIYQQDDRDQRDERRRRKLEPAYQFMVRVRLPGGVCRPDQWLALDELARTRANGTLRLTTRQTFQFHGIVKRNLRATIQGMHDVLLDTIAACGDVNRGVMATPLPELDAVHDEVYRAASAVSEHLLPRSRAYHEIWLNGEPVHQGEKQDEAGAADNGPGTGGAGGSSGHAGAAPGAGGASAHGGAASGTGEPEPLYGPTYLPRKFKIGFAVPPVNDVDVYTQDIGFIAITRDGVLEGFNVVVGGGMGRTDNEPSTYPRLGNVIGFCTPAQAVDVAEKILTIQRDYGNRVDRKVARMKYTIDRVGLAWFVDELHERLGWSLEDARPYRFETSQDRFGWSRNGDGSWNYTLFVENGRVQDTATHPIMTGLREIAAELDGDLRVTPNQNLIVARISERAKPRIAALLESHGIVEATDRSEVRRHSMACVAFPTCPLAMAESERYFPDLITKVEGLLAEAGLSDRPVVMRMSGCNNGCSRPYVAEVGFSGRAPGKYNVYLGGGFHGERLSAPYLENVGEETILDTLGELFGRWAAEGETDEPFGDFLIRADLVREVREGREFNG